MAISDAARTAVFLSPPIFLLFPSAALIHILDRIATRRFRNHFDSNIFDANFNIDLPRPDGKGTIEVTLLQKIGPGVAITAAYLAAYAVAVLSIAGIWQLRKVEGTARFERLWVWVVLVLNFLMVAGSLGVFGYATSVQVGDATWKTYNDAGTPGQKHTRETWACEINKFFPGQYWAGSVCGLSRGMRYLAIVIAAASVCVLAGLFVIIKSRGGMKWLFGGKGRYAGFQGVYEMQSQGPHAPYDGAPYAGPSTGQWGQQPIQPWPPVQLGHQQTGYQPVSQATPQQIGEMPKSDANGEQRPVFR